MSLHCLPASLLAMPMRSLRIVAFANTVPTLLMPAQVCENGSRSAMQRCDDTRRITPLFRAR